MSPAIDAGLPLGQLLAGWAEVPVEQSALDVRGLCLDSRRVSPGDLFFALAGTRSHGMEHAAQAAAMGACAIVFDPANSGSEWAASSALEIPLLPVERLGNAVGYIADRFFDGPSAKMRVLGVTGTNGKTSCSHFLALALGEPKAPSSVIGTLGWGVPGALKATTHTTPDAIEVHALLAKIQAEGVANVAMEASSHGLDQGRLNGIRFEGALFTNWSRDHLDYHQTMEAYLEAKLRLVVWPGLKFVAFNLDDESAAAVAARIPVAVKKLGFTRRATAPEYPGVEVVRAVAVSHGQAGLAFDVQFAGQSARLAAPVYGDFNVENLLGAASVLLALGYDLQETVRRLGKVRAVPGRMEQFATAAGPVAVVDYAHTPDALQKALASLRSHCHGTLWTVFGCGGDRDRGKRPQMGAIAESLADRIVLTDDNPRSENGDAIIREILDGCARKEAIVMRDRRQAIAWALSQLQGGDVLLVAGKGHEDTQDIGGVKHPFSDRAVVCQVLGLPVEGEGVCV
jgi:UDP-N-acetylmuramoyl-L-alanyl-D-glutamate--2,6-diaminopimelate ligase